MTNLDRKFMLQCKSQTRRNENIEHFKNASYELVLRWCSWVNNLITLMEVIDEV